jgi:hypothetical protein
MEQPTLDQERPYLRRGPGAFPWIEVSLAVLLTATTIGLFYYFREGRQETAPPRAERTVPAPATQAEAPPVVRNPLPDSDTKLPTLEASDSLMRETIARLIGRKAFDNLFVPDRIIPRIVATIDNLPRKTAPRRLMPLAPVPGPFIIAGASPTEYTIDAGNHRRYAMYVRAMDAVPARTLVWLYVQTYPLFQRAYEELGYGGQYFNDRLVETIDDLLAAPEMKNPVRLVQPKVFYQFADPELEALSAGQKMLLRMGPENAQQVRTKLVEIRQALAQPPTSEPDRPAAK